MKQIYLLTLTVWLSITVFANPILKANKDNNVHPTATVTSVTSGAWDQATTWSSGSVPGTGDDVIIAASHTVSINTGQNICRSLSIQANGTLSITGSVLSVGTSANNSLLNNNGTLTITGGNILINGGLNLNAGSVFNMSGGNISIDPNDGTAAGSLPGTTVFNISSAINMTGGAMNLVDPPYNPGQTIISYSSPLQDAAISSSCIITLGGGNDQNAANTDGFLVECRKTTGILEIGRLVVNGGRYSARRHMSVGFITKVKNITLTASSELVYNGGFLAVKGNIINDGMFTTTANSSFLYMVGDLTYNQATSQVQLAPSGTAQSIIGNGFFKNSITDADPTAQSGNLIRKFLTYHTGASQGVTLAQPLTISTELQIRRGKLSTDASSKLGLGTPASLPGYPSPLTPSAGLLTDSVTIPISAQAYKGGWVVGPFKRYFTSTVTTPNEGLMPVGSDTSRVIQISFSTPPVSPGYLIVNWSDINGSTNGFPLNEPGVTPPTINKAVSGLWTVDTDPTSPLSGGTYTGKFTNSRTTGVNDYTNITLIKRANSSSPWTLEGQHVQATGTNTNPTVSRTGLSGFGEYAIGGNAPTVVPVTVEYFRGSKSAQTNYLEWKITCTGSTDLNIALQRSADGKDFNAISEQNVSAVRCEQGFTYTDSKPGEGINYYRLKTITPDGAVKYSSIVALINKEKGFELMNITPNPVKTSTVIELSSAKGGSLQIFLTNSVGKLLMKRSYSVIAGNNFLNLNLTNFVAGIYNISAVNSDKETKTIQIVKY